MSRPRCCWIACTTTRLRSPVDVVGFRRVAVLMELRVRNIAVNSNCTACVDTDIVLAAQYQRHRGTFCLRITTPLHLVSVLVVFRHCLKSVYDSELLVDGKCIIGSLVRRTFTRGRHLLFYAILTCRICLSRKSADFNTFF